MNEVRYDYRQFRWFLSGYNFTRWIIAWWWFSSIWRNFKKIIIIKIWFTIAVPFFQGAPSFLTKIISKQNLHPSRNLDPINRLNKWNQTTTLFSGFQVVTLHLFDKLQNFYFSSLTWSPGGRDCFNFSAFSLSLITRV